MLYPNVFVEFRALQISQVMKNASKLFSVHDIMNCVEIWRSEHACGILNIFHKCLVILTLENFITVDIDWLDIRDDLSADVLVFQDSSLLQVCDEMDQLDRSIASLTLDTSSEIRNTAKEVTSVINTEDMEL